MVKGWRRYLMYVFHSDYTNTTHSMCKFIEDASVSHQTYNVFSTELWKLQLLFLGNRTSATPDTKNPAIKKPPLRCGQKYVETYSSSNAAAPVDYNHPVRPTVSL